MNAYRRNTLFIKEVADKFREIRKSKGLSQESVFIDTDYNIGRIESGKKNISISTLYDLCKYYNISLKDFFDGIENK